MYFSRTNVILFFSIVFVSSSVFAGSSSTTITPEKQLLNQVVKINTYQYNEQSQSYEGLQYGSAVIIAKNRIITNAHVILESETDTPTGFYEICLSNNFQTVPLCDRSARLISYDPIADLALLEASKDFSIPPVVLAKNPSPLSIGQAVVIYGYPTIGGMTITRTEGKIAGYENLVYKMDANIDHGNSGGGAFDSLGNLIGIPYALSSDNGVIGYMISRKTVDDFLREKTPGYQKVKSILASKFITTLSQNQSQMRQSNFLKGAGLELLNPADSGFHLVDTSIDVENSLSTWKLQDDYGRVVISLSCTRDATTEYGYIRDRDTLPGLIIDDDTYDYTGMTLGKTGDFYKIQSTPKSPKNDGSYEYMDTWYYKKHDACYAFIYYTSPIKDAKMIARAEKLLQSAKFRSPYVLGKDQVNPYFSITSIPDAVRSLYSIDTTGSKHLTLDFLIEPDRSLVARLRGEVYTSLREYFTKPYYNITSYSGTLTFDAFLKQFSLHIENDQAKILLSKNGKRMVFTYAFDAKKKEATINVAYPYILGKKYAIWYWSKTFSNAKIEHIDIIRSFFTKIDLPGDDPFS